MCRKRRPAIPVRPDDVRSANVSLDEAISRTGDPAICRFSLTDRENGRTVGDEIRRSSGEIPVIVAAVVFLTRSAAC